MHADLRKWLRISLFNLMLVAFVGVILRYKIAYSLPFIDHKKLLHAHSHFAFAGWITQALMALLVAYLSGRSEINYFPKYHWLLIANCITAYGMLVSFPFQGYGSISITFSTLSIIVSYFFAVRYWRDLNKLPGHHACHPWFKIALLGNVVSSIGPFTLAYMMATRHMHQNIYLASVYFFLHFQYNVWFFFTCMGLFINRLIKLGFSGYTFKRVFSFFALACLPTYFLSVLWWPVPFWLYMITVIAAFFQIAGWIILIAYLRKHFTEINKLGTRFVRFLFLLSAIALTAKLLLQTGSVIPSLSKLAFGFRPIVIGYLHLILLGMITIFIIGYAVALHLISDNGLSRTGIRIFVTGIIFNEILLMVQGISDIQYVGVPWINQLLLFSALVLSSGMFLIVYGQYFMKDDSDHKTSIFIY